MSRHDKRKTVRMKARTCRFQCGRRFDATVRNSQACTFCQPLLNAAVDAVNASSGTVFGNMTSTPRPVRVRLLIKRIKRHRDEFEAAWRLGADRETLRSILGWNHQEKRTP